MQLTAKDKYMRPELSLQDIFPTNMILKHLQSRRELVLVNNGSVSKRLPAVKVTSAGLFSEQKLMLNILLYSPRNLEEIQHCKGWEESK